MAGIKLTLRIKGQDSERRTATARNAEHLKDICRRWLAGYSDRGIRAEYMGHNTNSPYGEPHDVVADYIQMWATDRGWKQEDPKAEQREELVQILKVPAGMDIEKVIRDALDNGPAPKSALEAGQRVHEAIEREVIRMNTPEPAPRPRMRDGNLRFDMLMHRAFGPGGVNVDALIEALKLLEDNAMPHQPKRAMDAPGYEHLAAVLQDAYAQAAFGKGKERHANDLPFDHQPMQAISRLLGNPTGMTYQVCKKVVEAMNMKDSGARRRELLGAIVYLAGVVVYEDNKNADAESK
ncbi:TPA: hypothetical protein MCX08_004628 [Klebsiella pneumoniae]|nr:hypothetical protein [Klebsiella pneumoniae]